MSQDLFSTTWRQSDDFDHLSRGIPRWPFSMVTPQVIKALLVVNVIIYLAWGAMVVYRAQMRPNLDQLQTQAERATLVGEAEAHLAAERYGLAIRKFRELLTAFPGDETAIQGIARAEEGWDLAARYQQAVMLVNDEQWHEAIAALQEMMTIRAGYKDVPAQLTFSVTQQELAQLYQEAEAHFSSADWPAAIEVYEAIRRQSPDYRGTEVKAHLFESYFNRGTQLLKESDRSVPVVDEAIRLFRQALALQPKEPRASAQRQAVELYRKGLDLYLRGQWLEATEPLAMAHDLGLTLEGDVVEILRSAHAMAGDVYAEAGNFNLAVRQYQAALELMDDMKLATELLARQEFGKMISGKIGVEAYKALIDEYRRAINK